MKLFKLVANPEALRRPKNPWSPWYDKCFSLVVRAHDEAEARFIATNMGGDEVLDGPEAWRDPALSICEELTAEGKAGLILADVRTA